MNNKIDYIVNAVKWFDKINGNTYHSVKIIRCLDSIELKSHKIVYGYGEHYKQTAIELMLNNKWLPEKYNNKNYYMFERENNYPILWNETQGLKRDMFANVA